MLCIFTPLNSNVMFLVGAKKWVGILLLSFVSALVYAQERVFDGIDQKYYEISYTNPNAISCRHLLNKERTDSDAKASEPPGATADASQFFVVYIYDVPIPIPVADYKNFTYQIIGDGTVAGFMVSTIDGFVDISVYESNIGDYYQPVKQVDGLETYEQWLDYAYSIDGTDLNCDESSKDFIKNNIALYYKPIDSDICRVNAVHRHDWGWLLHGSDYRCRFRWESDYWKYRIGSENEAYVEVLIKAKSGEGYEALGYAFDGHIGEFADTPPVWAQILHCLNHEGSKPACYQSIDEAPFERLGPITFD